MLGNPAQSYVNKKLLRWKLCYSDGNCALGFDVSDKKEIEGSKLSCHLRDICSLIGLLLLGPLLIRGEAHVGLAEGEGKGNNKVS